MKRVAMFACVLLVFGCAGGGPGGPVLQAAPLVVAAGAVGIDPVAQDDISGGIDLARLGLSGVGAIYEVTTPAGAPFAFDVLTRADENSGAVRVSVGHASDGGLAPAGGAGTLANAGIQVSATGMSQRGAWLDANGDGFARCTLRGEIDRDQVIAVEADIGDGKSTALVCVRVGAESAINIVPGFSGDYPGVLEETTLYSSNSYLFGLPTVAVSGDRTSVVVYEGDRGDRVGTVRYEMRMQYDAVTKQVTGGGSEEQSTDWGNWRDHEIAALYNVLALVHSGTERVTLKVSFDRGATFGQVENLGTVLGRGAARLAQIAIAADYTLAVLFWRAAPAGTELTLVEGRPSAFDAGGSPTAYAFDAPRTLHAVAGDVTPIIMGAAYSSGGDLAIGYAYTRAVRNEFNGFTVTTSFRSAVRLFGEPAFHDVLIDEDQTVGKDPSVAVLGSGPTMRVFYAYEGRQGVRLRVSEDAGRTWSAPVFVGDGNAHMPTVIARELDGKTTVDLMYLAFGGKGMELHLTQWADYGTTPPQSFRLTEATEVAVPQVQQFAPPAGPRIREIAWFGYDAVLDGDDIVVVFDEVEYELFVIVLGLPEVFGALAPGADANGVFVPAEPPPLAPGMTEPLPAPDPDHKSQLRIKRYR